jgi:hypothetical protein
MSLIGLCRRVAEHYDFIDADLLLTGAVLHDIGKIYELDYRRSFGYSTEGQLLGHLIIGLQMVDAKIAGIAGFPPKLKMLVEHLVLSHHGRLGSARRSCRRFRRRCSCIIWITWLKIECMRMMVANDRISQVDELIRHGAFGIERWTGSWRKPPGAGRDGFETSCRRTETGPGEDGARAHIFREVLQSALGKWRSMAAALELEAMKPCGNWARNGAGGAAGDRPGVRSPTPQ